MTKTRLIVAVWLLGFAVGAVTHTLDLVLGGRDVYSDFPMLVRWFWVLLTVLDPLIIVLLVRRSRAAAPTAVIVMVADLAVNWSVFFSVGGLSLFGVIAQSLFGALVFLTATHVWWRHRRSRPPASRD